MATIFAKDFLGARFRVKLVDCLSGANVDVSQVVDQFIVFYKPDGLRFEEQATLVEDPVSSGDFFIQFTNSAPADSILDQVLKWEYAGRVVLSSGDSFESAERFVFWVK